MPTQNDPLADGTTLRFRILSRTLSPPLTDPGFGLPDTPDCRFTRNHSYQEQGLILRRTGRPALHRVVRRPLHEVGLAFPLFVKGVHARRMRRNS